MAYAAPAALLARYPSARLAELTDDQGQAVQQDRLATALADATAEIDGYLGRRYTLPLAQVPAVIERVCCDMALYRLMALLPKESVEDARRRYEDAQDWLKDLADGQVHLSDLAGGELPSSTVQRVACVSAGKVFGGGGLGGYL